MARVITPKEGEKVLLTLRKNPNKYGKQIFVFFALIIVSIGGFFVYNHDIVYMIAGAFLLFTIVYALYYLLIWFYDIYIISNARIIKVDQKGLFSREFIETDIDKIQDVTYSIKGIFATIFKYGTVTIRTSTGLNLELTDLSDPDEVQEMVKNLAAVTDKKKNKDLSAQELIDFLRKNS